MARSINFGGIVAATVAAGGLLFGSVAAGQEASERPDWAHYFSERGVEGTIVVVDERPKGGAFVFNRGRASERFLPASTFKIPHALFALDAGVVRDEFQVMTWDGTHYSIEEWNRDQTFHSAMRNSVVWVFQEFARRIGERRERRYLRKISYGNANADGAVDRFWLDGGLRISALEQVSFLQRLYRNQLPFAVEYQRLVKDLMINEAGKDWILRAKTGTGLRITPQVGWWVGWVERPDGAVFFASNIEMPRGGEDASKRIDIPRALLGDIGALPR